MLEINKSSKLLINSKTGKTYSKNERITFNKKINSVSQIIYKLHFGEDSKFNLYVVDKTKPVTIDNLSTLPSFKERDRDRELPKNVYFRGNQYVVVMNFDKLYHIGSFDNLEDAELAVKYCNLLGKPIKMSGKNLGVNLQTNTGKLWE